MISRVISILFIVCTISLSTTHALEVTTTGEMGVRGTSAYVWRGLIYNDEANIQAFGGLHLEDVTLGVWGSWNVEDVPRGSEHSRMDVMLDYTMKANSIVVKPGIIAYIYHDFPGSQLGDTYEIYVEYSLDVLMFPSMTLFYDFGRLDGFYLSLSVAEDFEWIKDVWSMDVGLSLGMGDKDYVTNLFRDTPGIDLDGGTLVDLVGRLSLPINLGYHIELDPSIKYTMLLDSTVRDQVEAAGGKAKETVYSLGVNIYF